MNKKELLAFHGIWLLFVHATCILFLSICVSLLEVLILAKINLLMTTEWMIIAEICK